MKVIFIFSALALASARKFLQDLSAQEVEDNVLIALRALSTDDRYHDILSVTEATFDALPKNDKGMLEVDAIEYLVQSYFAKQHGWHITGVGSRQSRSQFETKSHLLERASLLQDKAPVAVEAILKAKNGNRGFTLQDSITMIEVIENLVLQESQQLLQTAFTLLKFDETRFWTRNKVFTIMAAYGLLFESDEFAAADLPHQSKSALHTRSANHYMVKPVLDAIETFDYNRRNLVNPFTPMKYTWQDILRMTLQIHRNYGQDLNHQCLNIKSSLMDLEIAGTGRVSLKDFYNHSSIDGYVFAESKEYLRAAGVLDESVPSHPSVMIANYIYGPSNCAKNSAHFSVCCISTCESLMTHLEKSLQAPSVKPERIIEVVNGSAPFHEVVLISDNLASKLYGIAERNQGEVPIYGRLFSQWMHFAFPSECPYPQIVKNSSQLAPTAWNIGDNLLESDTGKREAQTSDTDGLNAEDVIEHMWDDLEIFSVLVPRRSQNVMKHILIVIAGVATMVCTVVSMAKQASGMVHHIRSSTTTYDKHMV